MNSRRFLSEFHRSLRTIIFFGIAIMLLNGTNIHSILAAGMDDGSSSSALMDEVRASDPAIKIVSDTELRSMATIEGWPGNGTEGNPYIIEGYDINGSVEGYCIWLKDTTQHTVIRGNRLHDANVESPSAINNVGILAEDCVNLTILNNHLEDNEDYGITVKNSQVNIKGNEIDGSMTGISVISSTGVVEDNNVSGFWLWGNNGCGINLHYSGGVTVRSNYIHDGRDHALDIYHSSGCIIEGNIVERSGYSIMSLNTWRMNIRNNTFGGGIWMQECPRTRFIGNDMGGSVAFNLLRSPNCYFKDNRIRDGIIHMRGDEDEYYDSHYIDDTNLIDGTPVKYVTNQTGGAITGRYSQIILANTYHMMMDLQGLST